MDSPFRENTEKEKAGKGENIILPFFVPQIFLQTARSTSLIYQILNL